VGKGQHWQIKMRPSGGSLVGTLAGEGVSARGPCAGRAVLARQARGAITQVASALRLR
jgi:hypothetical protein